MRKVSWTMAALGALVVYTCLWPTQRDSGKAYAGKLPLSYFEELSSLKEVLRMIQQQYVDGEKVEEQELVYGGIEGMLKKLDDPYTRYMKPEAFESMQQETSGEFGGLGILIGIKENTLTVISPIEGTPAYRAGIRAGDKIIKVNNKSTKGMSINDAVKLLRGPRGTKVTLSVRREQDKNPLEYVVARDIIKIPSVRGKMIDESIGYAYVSQFIQSTGEDLDRTLTKFESEHQLKGFILDLRNNPGGLLNAAVEVSKIFLGKSKIVSIKGRRGEEVSYSAFGNSHKTVPMVVLVNEGSASASEIVAGALRDNKRGILVGKKSFGKGSVQTVLPLPDGSAVALTTAHYYTPSGSCIHKVGISPDIDVDIPQMTEDELKAYREEREKTFQESTEPVSSSKKDPFMKISKYDSQLRVGVDLLRDGQIMLDSIQKRQPSVASAASGEIIKK
ncbi:MAG: S41 family peptidase [Candidatus Riflebacteria bacterium]|nr:S41 family peptidase [Candidatus Riflebacteria bacterium]